MGAKMGAPGWAASLLPRARGHVTGLLALRISVPTQDGGWLVSPAPFPWVEPVPQGLGEELLSEESWTQAPWSARSLRPCAGPHS